MKNKLVKLLLDYGFEVDFDLFSYGFDALCIYVLYLLIIIPVSVYQGYALELICFLFFFIPIRRYLGGFHFESEKICLITSVLMTIVALEIQKNFSLPYDVFLYTYIVSFISLKYLGIGQSTKKIMSRDQLDKYINKTFIIYCVDMVLGFIFIIFKLNQYFTLLTCVLFLTTVSNIVSFLVKK